MRKAICVHVYMSDNRGTLCDAENSCCLSISTIGRRCVTIKRFAYMFTRAIIGERCVTLKIVSCLSMSNIWRRCVTIKGICVHVERRNKFPRQLIPPLSKNSIDSSIPSMSYAMQP